MAESETADEDGDAGEDGVKEIEGPHSSNTDEVEQRALYAQIRKRLMQALDTRFVRCVCF